MKKLRLKWKRTFFSHRTIGHFIDVRTYVYNTTWGLCIKKGAHTWAEKRGRKYAREGGYRTFVYAAYEYQPRIHYSREELRGLNLHALFPAVKTPSSGRHFRIVKRFFLKCSRQRTLRLCVPTIEPIVLCAPRTYAFVRRGTTNAFFLLVRNQRGEGGRAS